MIFEEVVLKQGDTLAKVVNNYGYVLHDWKIVWNHQINSTLKRKRIKPENLKSGDIVKIPIPWVIISKKMSKSIYLGKNRFAIEVERNGAKGENLRWVQTVFGDNQSMHPTPFGVDFPDDDEPFYYTTAELTADPNKRKQFYDKPWRGSHAVRTTAWRAVLSLCSVSGKRVSIIDSIVWGVNFGKNGVNTKYTPRDATPYEISGHLRLLKMGMGRTKSFKDEGWTFREAFEN